MLKFVDLSKHCFMREVGNTFTQLCDYIHYETHAVCDHSRTSALRYRNNFSKIQRFSLKEKKRESKEKLPKIVNEPKHSM